MGKISKWRVQLVQIEVKTAHSLSPSSPAWHFHYLDVCKGTASDDQNQPDILCLKMVRGLALTLNALLAISSMI